MIISRAGLEQHEKDTGSEYTEKFFVFPNFLCRKHWSLCRVMIMHEPDQIDISCNKCDREDG